MGTGQMGDDQPATDAEPREALRGDVAMTALDHLRADRLERFARVADELADLRASVDERVRRIDDDIRELTRTTQDSTGRCR
jgi:hypothetical protein